MTQQLISMTQKELSRYEIIQNLVKKEINSTEAAKQLNLSTRQVRRLKVKVQKRGARGLIHSNRGKASNRRIKPEIVEKAKKYLKQHYPDFKPTFAGEKLEENHQVKLSSETVRQIMIDMALWQPKQRKKNKEYRSWRPRKEYYGEMEQFDGSYHQWFEKRAPECCLLASIDDATGKITKLKFVLNEGVIPVFGFWQEYVKKYGKPLKIYLDKYSTYKINAKQLLDDPQAITQFQRAMMDLDIKIIHAHSCQAKGRVEKLFGTLQDRLVKELRLHNILTIEEANKFVTKVFVPKFNQKFAVLPQRKRNLHRVLNQTDKKNLAKIFSVQEKRVVNNDFTISYEGKWYQLEKTQPTLVCRRDRILVEKRLEGLIYLSLRDKYLNFQELPERPQKVKMKVIALSKTKPTWKPPAGHPWRRSLILNPAQKYQTSSLVEKGS